MIGIVDYGLGNTQALINIYKRLGISATLVKNSADFSMVKRIILPGVGAFDWAMERLEKSGMLPELNRFALQECKPVLGICVGMQMMAHRSEEGTVDGLGWLKAEVKRFDETCLRGCTHLPHMGWNDVTPVDGVDLFYGMNESLRFYFLHSYYFSSNDPGDVLASTLYGKSFTCAVRRGNLYGVQFHPEKSHDWGVQLLKNFASI